MGRNELMRFRSAPSVAGFSVVGKKEGEGPLGSLFDVVCDDPLAGEDTWEEGESRIQQLALDGVFAKAGLDAEQVDCVFGGDLLNQCTATSYAVRGTSLPFFGLYGACSTCAEGHMLAAAAVDAGYAAHAASVASSHFCSAERQFRFPLEYGGQRTPTAQWTATAAGAFLFSPHSEPPYAVSALPGRIIDMGVTDMANMGAAMAPAAADTLKRYFDESGLKPSDFDVILSGDLGHEGRTITAELCGCDGIELGENYYDCGELIYKPEQDVHSGGSGCGCSALGLAVYLYERFLKKEIKNALFIGTGALMSPMSVAQGHSIPGIAHLVRFVSEV